MTRSSRRQQSLDSFQSLHSLVDAIQPRRPILVPLLKRRHLILQLCSRPSLSRYHLVGLLEQSCTQVFNLILGVGDLLLGLFAQVRLSR